MRRVQHHVHISCFHLNLNWSFSHVDFAKGRFFGLESIIPNRNLVFLRSTKYSAVMLETLSAPLPPPVNAETDAVQLSTEQESAPSFDLATQIQSISHPAARSSPQKETADHQDGERTTSLDLGEESGPLLYLSESLQESLTCNEVARQESDSGCDANKQTKAAGKCDFDVQEQEPLQVAEVEPVGAVAAAEPSAQQPLKLRKDKLSMLKKLGLDPPPVVKLRPDDGAFVKLEPPQPNTGKWCSSWS